MHADETPQRPAAHTKSQGAAQVNQQMPANIEIVNTKNLPVAILQPNQSLASIASQSNKTEKKVAKYKRSLGRKMIKAQEFVLRKERKIDKHGKIPTWLARRLRD